MVASTPLYTYDYCPSPRPITRGFLQYRIFLLDVCELVGGCQFTSTYLKDYWREFYENLTLLNPNGLTLRKDASPGNFFSKFSSFKNWHSPCEKECCEGFPKLFGWVCHVSKLEMLFALAVIVSGRMMGDGHYRGGVTGSDSLAISRISRANFVSTYVTYCHRTLSASPGWSF